MNSHQPFPKHTSLVLLLLAMLMAQSCSHPLQQDSAHTITRNLGRDSKAKWNYLVYMAADNNLERFAIQNIMDMKKVGSTDDVNILVLLDRSPGYDKTNGNWSDTRLLHITQGNNLNDDVVKEYGELDMTNPVVLQDFLTLARNHYPAENTALILWSHGTGVYPEGKFLHETMVQDFTTAGNTEVARGVIQDYSTDYLAKMTIRSLHEVLEQNRKATGMPLQLLQFDACLMQMVEVLWQLGDEVHCIVGSQADMPGSGSNYNAILSYLATFPNTSAEKLATLSVESFKEFYATSTTGISCSAITTAELASFQQAFSLWVDILTKTTSEELRIIQDIRQQCVSYDNVYTEYIDLKNFVLSIAECTSLSQSIRQSSQTMLAELEDLLLCNVSTNSFYGNLFGLSINWPCNQEQQKFYIMDSASMNVLKIYHDTSLSSLIYRLISL